MAMDVFMYFEGTGAKGTEIAGETKDSIMTEKKAMEIFSFSLGATNPTTIGSAGSGLSGGKVSITSFNIMKRADSSSPSIFKACCIGDHFPKAFVVMRRSGASGEIGGEPFMIYEFAEVMVESIQWSGSSGGDSVPTESASFAFGAMSISYMAQDATGAMGDAIVQSWSLTTNTATLNV
jgi:type VI secretion system secreted protein Hcp